MEKTSLGSGVAATDDVVIVGGGVSGLYCALKMAPRPVTLITATPIHDGAAEAWAQGGFAAAISQPDTPEMHAADTIAAGCGIVDARMAHLMTSEGPARVRDLEAYGVPFDRDEAGRLVLSRHAGHGERRSAGVSGDLVGREILAALVAAVRKTPSIRVVEGYSVEELVTDRGRISGLVAIASDPAAGPPEIRLAVRAVILATGGIGALYATTTNSPQARGQGLAVAARAGALVADTEFVQFHPTAIAISRDPLPVATEALCRYGATLVNSAGVPFLATLHPDLDCVPRDIAARAVHAEAQSGRGAFLNCIQAIGPGFADTYPLTYETCRAAGIDPRLQPIPVTAAAHYHMGGILTDASGRTSVDGLWACGEVASTGAHGASRLGANALLDAAVFSARVAEDVRSIYPAPQTMPAPIVISDAEGPSLFAETAAISRLRGTMDARVGVERDRDGLTAALGEIAALEREGGPSHGFRNMVASARLITYAAFRRTESRGAHFRSDFPDLDPAQTRRSVLDLRHVETEIRKAIYEELHV